MKKTWTKTALKNVGSNMNNINACKKPLCVNMWANIYDSTDWVIHTKTSDYKHYWQNIGDDKCS